ncbi:MAG: hypothetical protein MPJ06_03555 [Nitrosopumilus sp.]|nr:hypothetical protein [Nitrosopumilus sp.]MDA7943067.1 hypothetical protein [Nitrosopumilus sp.]
MDGNRGWTDGRGWTADELVWTSRDTAFVEATLRKNQPATPLDYDELIRHHESLGY